LVGSTISAGGMPNKERLLAYIRIGSGVLIAALIVGISLNYYALSNLQFRVRQAENFGFAPMSFDVEVCNPTAIPTSIDNLRFVFYYKDMDLATLTMHGGTLPPNKITVLKGNMVFNVNTFMSLFIQGLANAFSGQWTQLDQQYKDMTVKTILDTKVMGIFPFSQSRTFTVSEFQESIHPVKFSCIR